MFLNQHQAPLKAILVAIDHPESIPALLQAIQDETPCLVLTVSNSLEAVEATKEWMPDLLILDYYLSPLNGIELADHIHARKKMGHIPTIMLSDQRPHEEREINKRGLLSLGRAFELKDLLALLETAFNRSSCS